MSKVLYFVVKHGEPRTCSYNEMFELCNIRGFTSPVLVSRHIKDNGITRLATPKELSQIPIDEPGVRLAEPITEEREILFRFDPIKGNIDQIRLSWPTARYGEKTERGYALYIKEQELFPELA
jgi:hypothetical protein